MHTTGPSGEVEQTRAAIRRILVPLALHRVGKGALPDAVAEAQDYCQDYGAEVIVLHVCPPAHAASLLVSHAEAQARAYLDALVARLHAAGTTARSVIHWGRPAEEILREAVAQDVDLVILGKSRRRGPAAWLLGSVAAEVLARASCTVLLVRPPAVRSFADDTALAGPVAMREQGLRTVDVSRIVGTVGRAGTLREDFRSLQRSRMERQRFERILHLLEAGAMLPPVSLYKLGYGYYVLDGHHRIAAARQLGQLDIDAQVTEFVPLGDAQAQRVLAERRAFEQATGLQRIGAAVPGHFPQLEALIRSYATAHGEADLREAAQQWEGAVYRPVAALVRARRLSQLFPGERTADLVVRVVAYRDTVSCATGQVPDWETVLARLEAESPDGTHLAATSAILQAR
jgi:nucleotide-binding universal stress UspA family protein